MNAMKSRGFTLLEMILALTVFALLSLAAYSVLQNSIRNGEVIEEKTARLARIQYAFSLLERDLTAIRSRGSRTLAEGQRPVLVAEYHADKTLGDTLTFTHGNWFNPGALRQRSTLQRVQYLLQDGALLRRYSDRTEPVSHASLHQQILLKGVKQLKIRYYLQGIWNERWLSVERLPEAIEFTLELDDYGTIIRRFLLPAAQEGT